MSDYYSLSLPVAEMRTISQSPTLVLPSDSILMRRRIEKFAKHFKREMRFDFPQFEAEEQPGMYGYVPYEAYIFHEAAGDVWFGEGPIKQRFFGACCFRWREWGNASPEWSLDWVWLHPYFRKRGFLAETWPKFKQKYGDFHLAEPLSCCMKTFIQKIENR